jgi:hypothetical protein
MKVKTLISKLRNNFDPDAEVAIDMLTVSDVAELAADSHPNIHPVPIRILQEVVRRTEKSIDSMGYLDMDMVSTHLNNVVRETLYKGASK